MPYLIELNDWRLLRGIGVLLDHRKGRYQVQPASVIDCREAPANVNLFEVELRRTFMFKDCPRKLDTADFSLCQAKLKSLCSLLDDVARPRNITSGREGQAYPRLRAVANFLESTSGVVDLVNGPNETLFQLPNDCAALGRCLTLVTECNSALSRLLEQPSRHQTARPPQRQEQKRTWKKARIRNRATFVLTTLFEHFRCGTPHEVLLKLIEDTDEYSVTPSLQLLLSPCPKSESWYEAHCDSVDFGDVPISSIPDICNDLQQRTTQGEVLNLIIEKHGLYGAWAVSKCSETETDTSYRESLDQLIVKGAFKPLDLDVLFHKSPSGTFSPRDKRALAIKLGFCLMDFFDANVTSKKIYFLVSSKAGLKAESPHLAFGRERSTDPDLYDFRIGHPALLSFAKLLLEIDFGQHIDLDISPHNSHNQDTWVQLLDRVERLAEERNDSYLGAIRSCLLVHHKIAKALRSQNLDSKSVDSKIRKTLYKEVVHKLELGLAESTPRSAHKRQRSESPPPAEHTKANRVGCIKKTAIGLAGPESEALVYKKRRIPEPEQRQYRPLPRLIRKERTDQGNNAADEFPEKLNIARSSGSRHSGLPEPLHLNPSLSNRAAEPISVTSSHSTQSLWRASRRDEFEIAIICALPLEYDAVSYLFDEFWDEDGDQYGRSPGDRNNYTTGRIGKYNVVLALLPHMGKANAAGAAASMRASYGGLRLAFILGVCGAVPGSGDDEILLGDVVISKTIVQHDFGRQYSDHFIRKSTIVDNLARPTTDVRNLLAIFETDRGRDWVEERTAYFIQQIQHKVAQTRRRGKYDTPKAEEDKLFASSYRHKHHESAACICRCCITDTDPVCEEALNSSCADLGCHDRYLVTRERLQVSQQPSSLGIGTAKPVVHVGAVASGDTVMKSATHRDRISRDAGVIAFEMEGAGVWDEVPSIVVKGVCDYADCHKSKVWQNYAAATAAAACKAILERYVQTDKRSN